MGEESQVKIKIVTSADSAGVEQARNQYDELFNDLKKGIADTLSAGGADIKFISHVVDEFERLNQELQATGATGDEVAAKIARLEQVLQADAAAEEKRIRQLKVNFEMALHEKDVQEDAAALSRRRREEDQLAAEQAALATKRRVADLQEERELARSVAQARQMSAEQGIERAVHSQGAYSPQEEVNRLRGVEQQTARNAAAMRGYRGSVGDAALAFAYFADDAQYGMRGIMNNIPQVALMLGLGSGLAGAISLAAVALTVLWDKFGGAQEAKAKTNEVKEAMENLTPAIDAAVQAASDLSNAGFEKYLTALREATELWGKQKGHISEALAYQNELAKSEQAAAQAKLEIERQNKLAGARSDEERQQINATYDVRKAGIADTGKAEAMQRAMDAQGNSEGTLKARIKDAEGARDAGQQSAQDLAGDNQGIIAGIGQESDQARRRRESMTAAAGVDYMDGLGRDLTADENKRRNDFIARREAADVTKGEDEVALKTGKGVTFDQAKAASKESGDAASLKKYTEAEAALKDNAEQALKAAEEARQADEKIVELKLELAALEKQGVLLKQQQIAQQLEAQAADAKRAADTVASDQKADDARLKKQREEQVRKLENDAHELELKGDKPGAAKKRDQLEQYKLPDDATEQQRRKAALDARARRAKAGEPDTVDAHDVASQAGNIAAGLGQQGKQLAAAAEQLKDGATQQELTAVMDNLVKLLPDIGAKFGEQDKSAAKLQQQIDVLKSQFRNQRVGGA